MLMMTRGNMAEEGAAMDEGGTVSIEESDEEATIQGDEEGTAQGDHEEAAASQDAVQTPEFLTWWDTP
ncbi:hypothetical protein EJ02DRAFT_246375 [Clathrospora elynae]|uniref:Uncharacterized protein n=1 Tax=Clathrospora elynae TaxID=706981 RepID=A0A6A5SRL7_9PLEO|nr:hypothetical protein EJ02DRAFT_246375 [Clathrospora elynae]